MIEKVVIDQQELTVLFTIEDDDYGRVKKCFKGKDVVYVIDNKIVTDQETIKILNDRYEVKVPKEWMNRD